MKTIPAMLHCSAVYSPSVKALSGEDESIFNAWFESNHVPQFDINGITLYLRKYHGMKNAAIVLAYLRLRKDPQAARLLKRPVIKSSKP